MSNFLSEPLTTKTTTWSRNAFFGVGCSFMQGWRTTMEDAYFHTLDLAGEPKAASFAIFHGYKTSETLNENLHQFITSREDYERGNVGQAMKDAFRQIHAVRKEETVNDEGFLGDTINVIVKNGRLYCANIGNTRAVASVRGVVVPLANDLYPNEHVEFYRSHTAGCWNCAHDYQHDSNFTYKLYQQNKAVLKEKPKSNDYTEVKQGSLTADWEFVVLASNGIWNAMTNEQVVGFVRSSMAEGTSPEKTCENLMTACLAPNLSNPAKGCDNMTVIIVELLQGKTHEEVSVLCKRSAPIPVPKGRPEPKASCCDSSD